MLSMTDFREDLYLRAFAKYLFFLVGAPRFELGTPSPPDWCANRAALRSAVARGDDLRRRGASCKGLLGDPDPARDHASIRRRPSRRVTPCRRLRSPRRRPAACPAKRHRWPAGSGGVA